MQVLENSTSVHDGRTYKLAKLINDAGKTISVMQVLEEDMSVKYININLRTVMQRAYRSLGKDFESFDTAREHYKSAAVLSTITAAEFLFSEHQITAQA